MATALPVACIGRERQFPHSFFFLFLVFLFPLKGAPKYFFDILRFVLLVLLPVLFLFLLLLLLLILLLFLLLLLLILLLLILLLLLLFRIFRKKLADFHKFVIRGTFCVV